MIFVPSENRCWNGHLQSGYFTDKTIEIIQANKEQTDITAADLSSWILALTKEANS